MAKIDKKLFWIYALSALTFFSQGMDDLPSQSLFFYFKETLHLDISTIMYLGSLITIPWVIKPIWGWFSDSYFTKKGIVYATITASTAIAFLFGLTHMLSLPIIIGLLMLSNLVTAIRSTAVGGSACIEGKCYNNIDKLQSVRWISITAASVIVGLAGGYIAEHFSYQIAFLMVIPFYLFLMKVVSNFTETSVKTEKLSFWDNLLTYKAVFVDKKFLCLCLFLFLYSFAPSFGTPLTFIERDVFKWSRFFIGALGSIGAVASIIGAVLFYKFASRWNLKHLLIASVIIGALTALCYLHFTPVTAIVYDVVFSIVGMFLELVVMTWMSESALPGKEATSFAVMCSITNLAGMASNVSGAWLLPKIGLTPLICISSLTSFACLPLMRFLTFNKGEKNG